MLISYRALAIALTTQFAAQLTATGAFAAVSGQPTLDVQIDDTHFSVPVMSSDAKTFSIGADGEGAILQTIGALVQLSGDFKPKIHRLTTI